MTLENTLENLDTAIEIELDGDVLLRVEEGGSAYAYAPSDEQPTSVDITNIQEGSVILGATITKTVMNFLRSNYERVG